MDNGSSLFLLIVHKNRIKWKKKQAISYWPPHFVLLWMIIAVTDMTRFVHDRENNFMVFKYVYWHVVAFSSSPATRGNSSGASPSWAVVLFAAPWKRSKWDVALINATLRRFCWEATRFCPLDPLMSFRSHPVATTQRRFRLNFWNMPKFAISLHQ